LKEKPYDNENDPNEEIIRKIMAEFDKNISDNRMGKSMIPYGHQIKETTSDFPKAPEYMTEDEAAVIKTCVGWRYEFKDQTSMIRIKLPLAARVSEGYWLEINAWVTKEDIEIPEMDQMK